MESDSLSVNWRKSYHWTFLFCLLRLWNKTNGFAVFKSFWVFHWFYWHSKYWVSTQSWGSDILLFLLTQWHSLSHHYVNIILANLEFGTWIIFRILFILHYSDCINIFIIKETHNTWINFIAVRNVICLLYLKLYNWTNFKHCYVIFKSKSDFQIKDCKPDYLIIFKLIIPKHAAIFRKEGT